MDDVSAGSSGRLGHFNELSPADSRSRGLHERATRGGSRDSILNRVITRFIRDS